MVAWLIHNSSKRHILFLQPLSPVRNATLAVLFHLLELSLTRPFTFRERGVSRDRKPVKPVC